MEHENLENAIKDILPQRERSATDGNIQQGYIENEASSIIRKKTASELAKLKYREKHKQQSSQPGSPVYNSAAKKAEVLDKLEEDVRSGRIGIDGMTQPTAKEQSSIYADAAINSAKKAANIGLSNGQMRAALTPSEISSPQAPVYTPNEAKELEALKGTSRPEIARLMKSLNINLNVQLTRQDTASLLSALLTCNETQLRALYKNNKVPVVIKTVINRLLKDQEHGNISTIDYIWDKVFGKGPFVPTPDPKQQAQVQIQTLDGTSMPGGIIPNTPISREAYILIRDTLLK